MHIIQTVKFQYPPDLLTVDRGGRPLYCYGLPYSGSANSSMWRGYTVTADYAAPSRQPENPQRGDLRGHSIISSSKIFSIILQHLADQTDSPQEAQTPEKNNSVLPVVAGIVALGAAGGRSLHR
ncbi:MAG: hypothetical protein ACLUIW_02595 [Dysosmobacter welbionis]